MSGAIHLLPYKPSWSGQAKIHLYLLSVFPTGNDKKKKLPSKETYNKGAQFHFNLLATDFFFKF